MLLQAKSVSHSFDTLLYEGVDLQLQEGESIAILGVSGSGKSTLLANLSTMLKPNSGVISLLDSPNIYALKPNERLKLLRENLGIIFQAHYLFRGFSALENLQVSEAITKKPIDMGLLENLGIAHTLHQNSADLSGGQQQRLSIARVLLKKPRIIYADEPTGNLDKSTAKAVMDALQSYIAQNRAGLIIATHDENIAKSCTYTYAICQKGLQRM
ncbi:ABC transporter ATP-binding protein [Helicobacter sp. T3_23-1059]